MIWFIIIAVVVIVFYAIVSCGTSIKSVEDECEIGSNSKLAGRNRKISRFQKKSRKWLIFAFYC